MDNTPRMVGARFVVVVVVAAGASLVPRPSHAEPGVCRVIELDFTPASVVPRAAPQIVGWLETPGGVFEDTIFITRETGTYGLGNRPGRFDFNSGPGWPYGRRITVFPVWSHRNGLRAPQIVFQDGADSNLSHQLRDSTREPHYCQPLLKTTAAWDAVTCASPRVYTDKGTFSPTETSGYPPRADVARVITPDSADSASVEQYKAMNPFDAVSGATPAVDAAARVTWTLPDALPDGAHVLWLEVSLAGDMNDTYNPTRFPPPTGISFGNYGEPYRGQPSVLYQIPFTIGPAAATMTTAGYAGYGDPTGSDGALRAPDATITSDVEGSGAARLRLSDGYRARVTARSEHDASPPAMPAAVDPVETHSRTATLAFVAPGDDGNTGRVASYEVRATFGLHAMDAASFAAAPQALTEMTIVDGGAQQTITVDGLLPETDYTVGLRAFDDCGNPGPLAFVSFTTAPREVGEVDACFVATVAYGSVLANDVELLRRFRDSLLRRSALGELLIESYYTFGPAVAGVIGESELLRSTARSVLAPLVSRVRGARF